MNIWDWLLDDRDVFVSYRILGIVIAVLVLIAIVTVCVFTTLAISRSYVLSEANSSSSQVNKCVTAV